MKVLVRRLNNEKIYTWEDAEFINGRIRTNGIDLNEINIVSVADDDRGSYVKCSGCNQIILNTPEEIEKHRKRYLDTNTCFTCSNIRAENTRCKSDEYTFLSGNTYVQTVKYEVNLKCAYRSWYGGPHINTEEARHECFYKRCETAAMNPVEDIFMKHPGIFDDIITSDKIIEVGYKERLNWNRQHVAYQLNGRNQIFAIVNDLNIVDHFVVRYHNDEWTLYYSKMKNELYCGRNTYQKWRPDMSDKTIQYIKNKISELYV